MALRAFMTHASSALVALFICLLFPTLAWALPSGVALDRVDVTLEVPDAAKDKSLQTRQTVVLYATSSSYGTQLPLEIAPFVVVATDLASGAQVSTSRRATEDAAFTDVTLPNGSSRVKLEFTTPLFDAAYQRFWWDETQIVLGWPFAAGLKPLRQGMQVTVFLPSTLSRPAGFACVSEAGRIKCTRFVTPAELARLADSRKGGLVIGSIPQETPLAAIISAGLVALWCLLLPLITTWRLVRRGAADKKERLWLILRTGLAVILLGPSLVAFGLLADGDTDGPLTTAMTWVSVVFGVVALLLVHMASAERPIRTKIAQLVLAGCMPISVAASALAAQPMVAAWVAGSAAVVAFLLVYGKNE